MDVAVQGVREQGRQRMLQQLLLLWGQLQTSVRGVGEACRKQQGCDWMTAIAAGATATAAY